MTSRAPLIVDRYAIYDRIAAGGMATVHVGRLVGEGGFSRTVAVKRLHAHLALDPEFVSMFLDEARLAARIRHPNVVQTLDVVVADSEVFLVMEYVEGESLACLLRILAAEGQPMHPSQASALVAPILHGLHAAHEAKTDQGEPLAMVHRDVSPQNVLIGIDGIPRILDFGVAKALGQSHSTRKGELKGKLAYMSPEQIEGRPLDRRTDVFAASVVLWESLTSKRLFRAEQEAQVMRMVLSEPITPPSAFAPHVPPQLDAVVMRGLARDPALRFSTAEEMADALEEAMPPVPTRKLATWVQGRFSERLVARARLLKEIESASTIGAVRPRGGGEAAIEVLDDIATNVSDEDDAPTRIPTHSSIVEVAPPAPPRASGSSPLWRIAVLAGVVAGLATTGAVLATRGGDNASSTAAAIASSTASPPPTSPVSSTVSSQPVRTLAPEDREAAPTTPVTHSEPSSTAPAASARPKPLPALPTTPPGGPHPPASHNAAPASTLYSRF